MRLIQYCAILTRAIAAEAIVDAIQATRKLRTAGSRIHNAAQQQNCRHTTVDVRV